MAYDPKVAKIFGQELRRAKASPMLVEAAYEAGLVESGLQELDHGDRDSLGPLQQRPSQGWGTPAQVKNSRYAIRQFIERAQALQAKGFTGSSGDLAQAVQRSAFPDKYEQRDAEAEQLAAKYFGGASSSSTGSLGTSGRMTEGRAPSFTPEETKTDTKGAIVDALRTKKSGESLLQKTKYLVDTGAYTTTTPSRLDPGKAPKFIEGEPVLSTGEEQNSGGDVEKLKREADRIDDARVPYLLGGGHGARQPRGSKVTPLDCSGAVSRVIGIDPRVSGQFMKWGKPGRGKRVTIYADAGHVLMEIDGHFWGTSGSNPGGGAGWIPREKISKQYLSRFTVRHPAGQ